VGLPGIPHGLRGPRVVAPAVRGAGVDHRPDDGDGRGTARPRRPHPARGPRRRPGARRRRVLPGGWPAAGGFAGRPALAPRARGLHGRYRRHHDHESARGGHRRPRGRRHPAGRGGVVRRRSRCGPPADRRALAAAARRPDRGHAAAADLADPHDRDAPRHRGRRPVLARRPRRPARRLRRERAARPGAAGPDRGRLRGAAPARRRRRRRRLLRQRAHRPRLRDATRRDHRRDHGNRRARRREPGRGRAPRLPREQQRQPHRDRRRAGQPHPAALVGRARPRRRGAGRGRRAAVALPPGGARGRRDLRRPATDRHLGLPADRPVPAQRGGDLGGHGWSPS